MKMAFFLLVSLLQIQTNCLSQNDRPTERSKRNYREVINLYPQSLVSHFPKNIDNFKKVGLLAMISPRGRYLSYIHLAIPYEEEDIELIKKDIASKAKGIYHFQDSCLMLPYDYAEFEVIKSDSIRNLPYAKMLPLPHFRLWGHDFYPDFYQEAVIYLLNAEKGRFLPDNRLSRFGVGLPEDWVHGYTKGLVFWRNYVLYWLEVW